MIGTEFEKMIRLLDSAWLLRDEIVPCLVGPPGIGKTAAVKQHAQAHGCGKIVKIVASRCVPSETVGMTMPDHAKRSMEIYNSMQLSSLEDGDILFLDELLEADQFVLSTLLTVIESREMADGTPLPDIQIVAATNDTISPEQLKPNIRQRFMFMRFGVDMNQTRDYIFDRTGLRIEGGILSKLCQNGSDYNFLTPRSLTKLCLWMSSAPADKIDEVADVINCIWNSNIGSKIAIARIERDKRHKSPERQIKEAVKRLAPHADMVYDFDNCTLSEMYDILQELPDWEVIQDRLSELEVEDSEEDINVDIEF